MPQLVKNPDHIRLALVGMIPDNHHPFSWSAIINGNYDRESMRRYANPIINRYLGAQPEDALGIDGAQVTHIWCDHPDDARRVAEASRIPHVVERPEDVIGQVDAVLIPTDDGEEHVERARPFIEADVPVFIDKPLAASEDDLERFEDWSRRGKAFVSCSAARYSREFAAIRERLDELGDLRLVTITMVKSWERYGMHALEGAYTFLRPGGWISAVNTGDSQTSIVHFRHRDGVNLLAMVVDDLAGTSMANLQLYGTTGFMGTQFSDFFSAFKAQLASFVGYLRTGVRPFPIEETFELTRLLIAGIHSRDDGGSVIDLTDARNYVTS